jgi:hypothetical protein
VKGGKRIEEDRGEEEGRGEKLRGEREVEGTGGKRREEDERGRVEEKW